MGIGKRQVKVIKTNEWGPILQTKNFVGFIGKSKSSIEAKSGKRKSLAQTNVQTTKKYENPQAPSKKMSTFESGQYCLAVNETLLSTFHGQLILSLLLRFVGNKCLLFDMSKIVHFLRPKNLRSRVKNNHL